MKFDVPKISFLERQLSNGLQVVLHRNARLPLVHLTIHYRVGSSYEDPGQSGLAHLFEHLMFQGSENVEKNGHGRYIDEAGGRWNASTTKDRTNYYETVPAHYLDLALWLEADRMSSLKVTEENFENQRQTVIEEKKQSYDNRPYGLAYLRFEELAYENWAYAHSVIGSVADLEQATIEDARRFHQRFYGPGNAVLVLTGDLDLEAAGEAVTRYFGDIPNRTEPTAPSLSEPIQLQGKFERIKDELAVLAALIYGYHIPPLGTPEHYALSLLSLILADGDSSRLYRKFVYDNNWISGLFAGPSQYKGPQLFRIWIEVQKAVEPEKVAEALEREIEQIILHGVEDSEMEKARNQVAHRFVARLGRVSQVGELLAKYACLHRDTSRANEELSKFLAVTAQDVQDAARAFLRPESRTLVQVDPGESA